MITSHFVGERKNTKKKSWRDHIVGGRKKISLTFVTTSFGLLISFFLWAPCMSNGVYAAITEPTLGCNKDSDSVGSSSTLSVSISTNTLSADVISTKASGTFATSNLSSISIVTNHCTGYTLSIGASTDSENPTALVNTADSTKFITSISSAISESDFSATTNTQYNNQWGYKPSKFNSVANNTNYYPAPPASGDILDVTDIKNSTANTYNISFGTRIDLDTAPGTYSNTYVITAIVNPTPYTVTYDANTTDTVANMPTPNPETNVTYDKYAIISSAFPVRSGYEFSGWCTSNKYEDWCNGSSYWPGGSYTINQTTESGNTFTLYAIWKRNVALLDVGRTVNEKLKRLAGHDSVDDSTEDTFITALYRSDSYPPGDFTPSYENTISDSGSTLPIYAWYDSEDAAIYYYSEANTILMNEDSSFFFNEMQRLSDLSTISDWDTSEVTSMAYMFSCAGFQSENSSFNTDLSLWDTSSVTDMSNLFSYSGYNDEEWSVGDLSSWDTSSVTNMSGLFSSAGSNANNWSVGDLSSWDTSSVTNMSGMFAEVGNQVDELFIGDISGWDTHNVTSMSSMFDGTGRNVTNFTLDLSAWDVSNVVAMTYMFSKAGTNASSFNLDLSSWVTSSVTNVNCMFCGAGEFTDSFTLNLSTWDTSSVTNMSNMFNYTAPDASTWSVTIPKTNDGTSAGAIANTTSRLYGKTTSIYDEPPYGKSFTISD